MRPQGFFTIGLFIAFLGVQSAISQERIVMPEGFHDLQMGMTLDKFMSTRTNAQPFSLFPEHTQVTNRPSEMYIEHVKGHPFFDDVLYRFQDNALDFIGFIGRISGQETNKGERFLKGLLSEWGEPNQSEVVELDEGKGSSKAPAVIWKRQGLLIAASFTPDARSKATGRGSLQLKIQRDQEGQGSVLDKVFIVPSVSQKEKDAILVPVRSAVAEWRTSQPKEEKDNGKP